MHAWRIQQTAAAIRLNSVHFHATIAENAAGMPTDTLGTSARQPRRASARAQPKRALRQPRSLSPPKRPLSAAARLKSRSLPPTMSQRKRRSAPLHARGASADGDARQRVSRLAKLMGVIHRVKHLAMLPRRASHRSSCSPAARSSRCFSSAGCRSRCPCISWALEPGPC